MTILSSFGRAPSKGDSNPGGGGIAGGVYDLVACCFHQRQKQQ